jgi:hypothetical protein
MPGAGAEYEKLMALFAKRADVEAGQMFGKPCLKIKGKAFIAQHLEAVIFKLPDPAHKKALAIAGAALWDPSGKGRPMKEWVAVPAKSSQGFDGFAKAALDYVGANA